MSDNITRYFHDTQATIRALRAAQLQAMRQHIYGDVPMVSWKDGKVVYIQPAELIKMLEASNIPLFGPPVKASDLPLSPETGIGS